MGVAAQDVCLPDHAAVQVAAQEQQRILAVAHGFAMRHSVSGRPGRQAQAGGPGCVKHPRTEKGGQRRLIEQLAALGRRAAGVGAVLGGALSLSHRALGGPELLCVTAPAWCPTCESIGIATIHHNAQWPSARRGWSSARPTGSTSRHQAGAASTSRLPKAAPLKA